MKKHFFNQEQLDELKQYELHFYTAVKENYKRATPAALNDKIADVYEEMTGIKLNRNWSCGTCVLNAFKAVGQLYFDSVENLKAVQKEPEPTPTDAESQKGNRIFGAESTNNDSTLQNTESTGGNLSVSNTDKSSFANNENKPKPKKAGRPKSKK